MTKHVKEVVMGDRVITLEEENEIVTVQVHSEDVVIKVKDEVVWSIGNDKEEFKRIPKNLHSFIINSGYDHIDYIEGEKETVVDTYVEGEVLSLYIPSNFKNLITGRFDFISSAESVRDYLPVELGEIKIKELVKELESKINHVKKVIEDNGYKMSYSHDMGNWAYAWWDILFKASEFDEVKIKNIMKEVKKFNKYIYDFRYKYDI